MEKWGFFESARGTPTRTAYADYRKISENANDISTSLSVLFFFDQMQIELYHSQSLLYTQRA